LRAALDDSLAAYGIAPEFHVAFFFPDTYEFYWTITAGELIRFFKKQRDEFWTAERLEKAKAARLTPEQVVVLASIVEAETAQNAEKPTVAGVYINRLRRGEKLRADPTVIFALGNPNIRRVLYKHLKVDSPYNTYKYRGLPPGPINAPSAVSIDAVLNYEKHDYLFFCARSDFSGFHNFSRTYEEHKAYARDYQTALDSLLETEEKEP
ncbi:MAG: endolytic transglycosylase MltG, partial [Bacteroidia bacterium]|nr:endolytic transglycosylase MltG [Bacteroidia bacterium]MDW8333079.1 endolytic transglycosylase MltG [Bacteroidia bacterium]